MSGARAEAGAPARTSRWRSTVFQVRFHGRGGQGVVTAAELLADSAFKRGHFAQAFPSFGSERTGAPVVSFCRIDDKKIRVREPIAEPDAVIVQDPTLLSSIDVCEGLKPDGYFLLNSAKSFQELGIAEKISALPPDHVVAIPATELAVEHIGRPLPNAVLLGAFAALRESLTLESVVAAISDRFGGAIAEKNIAAATAAFELVAGRR